MIYSVGKYCNEHSMILGDVVYTDSFFTSVLISQYIISCPGATSNIKQSISRSNAV